MAEVWTEGDLVRLALRRNPRRRQLLVSTVLGKHIPVSPSRISTSAAQLAAKVHAVHEIGGPVLVCGFAETATGLTEAVADELDAELTFVTTRFAAQSDVRAALREEHSHAPDHVVAAEESLVSPELIVVVDDELTTGATAAALAQLVAARHPQSVPVVVAALVDAMTDAARDALRERIGHTAAIVSLGRVDASAVADATESLAEAVAGAAGPRVAARPDARATLHDRRAVLPSGLSVTSRYGWTSGDRAAIREFARSLADDLMQRLPQGPVLVLGSEEAMWMPQLLAARLEERGIVVRSGSTTRSPIRLVDLDGYPVRDVVSFDVPGLDGERYAHNVGVPESIVLVVDDALTRSGTHYRDAAVQALLGRCRVLHVVALERSE